jgi:hypothetical protein
MYSVYLKPNIVSYSGSNARGGSEVGFAGLRRWLCSVSEGIGHVCSPKIGTTFSTSF